jgi:uncharacterized metal-binding protein YceD (DUF177 family)
MIDIKSLFESQNAETEDFSLSFKAKDFPDLELVGGIEASGRLIRVEEGITFILKELTAAQNCKCVRCDKKLELPLKVDGSEWLFYEKRPHDYDDFNELMQLDKMNMILDPKRALRQDIILNLNLNPHCKEECVEFKAPEMGRKSLAGLKDLMS